jgi:hypothetical protein
MVKEMRGKAAKKGEVNCDDGDRDGNGDGNGNGDGYEDENGDGNGNGNGNGVGDEDGNEDAEWERERAYNHFLYYIFILVVCGIYEYVCFESST